MNTYPSVVEQRGAVVFPQFTGERVYMREIRKNRPLPQDLSRWQATVDSMLDGVDTDGPVYLMIDQSMVKAGVTQRRPGLHIDGYWHPDTLCHGGGGRHCSVSSAWRTGGGRWGASTFKEKEALILASDVSASRAMKGTFTGQVGEGGDCSHIDVSTLEEVLLLAGKVYAGNVTMLHESLPVSVDTQRTLVRLSVPGWSPELH